MTTTASPPAAGAAAAGKGGTFYTGDPGMWSWVLHRITGVLTFFFLFVHVLDTALVRVSPAAYDEVIATYKTPLVGLLEIALIGAVLYHALNGLRVMLVDFWANGPRYQRQMLWGLIGVWLLVMIPGTWIMGERIISDVFGGGA